MGTSPSSWQSLSTMLTALGGATEVAGSFLGTAQAQRVAEANAGIAQRNAQMSAYALQNEATQDESNARTAENDAQIAATASAYAVRQSRKMRARDASANLAAIGSSGVAVEGSPLETLVENAREAEMEGLLIKQRGMYAQAAAERQAQLLRYGATVKRYQAQQALESGAFTADVTRYAAPSYASALLRGLGTAGRTGAGMLRPVKTPAVGADNSLSEL